MMVFQHAEPNVNGGGCIPVAGSDTRNHVARQALDALDDKAFSAVVTKAMRDRPWLVSQMIMAEVPK